MIVWINLSHFQDTQSGYNIITFQEGFKLSLSFRRSLGLFRDSLFSDFILLFHNEPLTQLEFSVVVPTYF
jgi:hypothetical protein